MTEARRPTITTNCKPVRLHAHRRIATRRPPPTRAASAPLLAARCVAIGAIYELQARLTARAPGAHSGRERAFTCNESHAHRAGSPDGRCLHGLRARTYQRQAIKNASIDGLHARSTTRASGARARRPFPTQAASTPSELTKYQRATASSNTVPDRLRARRDVVRDGRCQDASTPSQSEISLTTNIDGQHALSTTRALGYRARRPLPTRATSTQARLHN